MSPEIDSAKEFNGGGEFGCRRLSVWPFDCRFFVELERLLVVTMRWTLSGAGANGRPRFGAIGTSDGLIELDEGTFFRFRFGGGFFGVDGTGRSAGFN